MERRIPVEGCHNFRDLGGYPTDDGGRLRWRLLFRADGLHELTERGVATLRDELALGDIVDLRSSTELDLDGRGPLADTSIRFHHLPLFDGSGRREPPPDWPLADLYLGMVESARVPLARVLDVLAGLDAPAVFHCAAGKDRTGVVSALILGLAGVRDEVIVADYAATREALGAIVARLEGTESYKDIWNQMPPETLHAEPATMETFLGRMRERYGSMRGYAMEIGVAEEALDRLRERLVEPKRIASPSS